MPPAPDPDRARECYGTGIDAGSRDGGVPGCLADQICLQGRCYDSCHDASDCGPREECGPSGACIRATHDAGPLPDAGPGGLCDDVECTAPQVCHPLSGTCVDCNEDTQGAGSGDPGHCSVAAPICDIANGSCVPFAPRECAPCNSGDACTATDGSFTGTCVLRETLGVRERVCLLPCTADAPCPSGLECAGVADLASGMDTMVCVPPIEMPCTNWLAGQGSGRSCSADGDCAPLGGGRAVYTDACEGEAPAPDGGTPTAGHCLLPCGASDDCPDPTTQQCTAGAGTTLFCRPL